MACKYVFMKRKVGLQFWSANLVCAFIGVLQAQTFCSACSKRKCSAWHCIYSRAVQCSPVQYVQYTWLTAHLDTASS